MRTSDQRNEGMREEHVDIANGPDTIPASLWLPDGGTRRAVVLLGHGLGVDRHHAYNKLPARFLTESGCAVLIPELPLHGERRSGEPADWQTIVDSWQAYWAAGGVEALVAEWRVIQRYAQDRFPELALGYFGLSLGTQYGIPFLARNDSIGAAVLGLFGSLPRPKTPVMNRYAPMVTCPVTFIKQTDDEIHPSATVDHLFHSLGSKSKCMIEGPGRHAEVQDANIREATRSLVHSLRH